MSFGHALYYPYINLKDKNWLKHAFLFWDKISRIVPRSVSPADNEDIIRIKYETGFIENYSPDRWVISNAFRSFSDYLKNILENDEFYRYYRRRYFEEDEWDYHRRRRFRNDFDFRRQIFKSIAESSGSYIHIEKLDRRLKNLLIDLGLAIPGDTEWDNWIKIDNEFGYIYMTYLAKSISIEKSLPIVTDVEHFYSASEFFEKDFVRDYNAEFEYSLGNLLIATFVPKDINSVPFDKLIELRSKYSAERIAFFNIVSDLCQKIQSIDTKSALEDALNHYSTDLINQTKELKSCYENNKIETITKFLNISVPTTLVSMTNLIPVEFKALGIGAGLLFGLASYFASIKKAKLQLQKKPLSYLLNIHSELSGENIFRKINDTAKGLRRW